MIYFISRLTYGIILKLFFSLKVQDRENIPKKGPFILVGNHVSNADPVVMAVACRTMRLRFLAKRELFDRPFMGAWCRACGCIPIERYSGSSAPLKKSLNALKNGKALGVFPEGTRSRDGKLQKAQPGVGIIAAKSRVPIIPVYISGTDKALPIGGKFPRPHPIKVKVGKALDINGARSIANRRKSYESIGERIMEAIGRLKHE